MPQELRLLSICVVVFAASTRVAQKRAGPIDAIALFIAGAASVVSLVLE